MIVRAAIPTKPTKCALNCVYNKDGICDCPRINRDNSDSFCHKLTPRKLLTNLTKI
jgi:hypothetical protein